MAPTSITLAGKELPIAELDFSQLRVLLPAINRVAMAMKTLRMTEDVFADLAAILSAATGIPAADLDKLKVKAHELPPAFQAVVELAGLEPAKEDTKTGNAMGREAPTGTTSTPTSQPSSDGTGSRSTG